MLVSPVLATIAENVKYNLERFWIVTKKIDKISTKAPTKVQHRVDYPHLYRGIIRVKTGTTVLPLEKVVFQNEK